MLNGDDFEQYTLDAMEQDQAYFCTQPVVRSDGSCDHEETARRAWQNVHSCWVEQARRGAVAVSSGESSAAVSSLTHTSSSSLQGQASENAQSASKDGQKQVADDANKANLQESGKGK
jgi:hypothetical protein